jgi:hypothetical protein
MLKDSGVTDLLFIKTLAKIKLATNSSKTHATSMTNRFVFTRDLFTMDLFVTSFNDILFSPTSTNNE